MALPMVRMPSARPAADKFKKQHMPMTLAQSKALWPMVWSSMGGPLAGTLKGLKTSALQASTAGHTGHCACAARR
eukprot:1273278-Alexandrium_andersonii.AAC.1